MTYDNKRLSHMIHRCGYMLGHYHGTFNIRPSQIRILRNLYEKGTLSQKELLEIAQVKPASLSEMLSKMEQRGYITRQKDVHDKRVIMVTLTAEGERYYLSSAREHDRFVDEVFSTLSQEDKENLGRYLDILLQNANQYLESE